MWGLSVQYTHHKGVQYAISMQSQHRYVRAHTVNTNDAHANQFKISEQVSIKLMHKIKA